MSGGAGKQAKTESFTFFSLWENRRSVSPPAKKNEEEATTYGEKEEEKLEGVFFTFDFYFPCGKKLTPSFGAE